MFTNSKLLTRVAPVVLGIAAAGAAYASSDDGDTGPAICQIKATQQGSMISLEGVVLADSAVTGTYRFQIASVGGSGNTNIRQGGGFSASAGDEVTLGKVMVGGYGASYDASLEVTLGGETYQCSERVGSI